MRRRRPGIRSTQKPFRSERQRSVDFADKIRSSARAAAEQAIAIRARLKSFRRTQLRQADRIERSHDEHEGIMTAIAQGDGEEAAWRMRAYMLNAASAIGSYIAARAAT